MDNDTVRISPDNPFTLREKILRDVEYSKSRLIDVTKYPFTAVSRSETDKAKEANAEMQKVIDGMMRTYGALFGITVLHIDNLWSKELKRRRRELHWWNFKAIRELDWDADEWKAAKRQELEREAQAIKNIIY